MFKFRRKPQDKEKEQEQKERRLHLNHTGVRSAARYPCRYCDHLLDERGWL